jgi:Ca2+-dependent lipid-binding protein
MYEKDIPHISLHVKLISISIFDCYLLFIPGLSTFAQVDVILGLT